jgi:hypothetical protein
MDPVWDEYKRRRRAFRLALLLMPLWIVPGAVIRYILIRCGLDARLAFFSVVLFPPYLNLVVAYWRWMSWNCPRCGRRFFHTWIYGNPFSNRCVHCGLMKWAPAFAETESASTRV